MRSQNMSEQGRPAKPVGERHLDHANFALGFSNNCTVLVSFVREESKPRTSLEAKMAMRPGSMPILPGCAAIFVQLRLWHARFVSSCERPDDDICLRAISAFLSRIPGAKHPSLCV